MTRVLFVCLGNICRSPAAEGLFLDIAKKHGINVEVDSAGTGDWHVDEPPDPRMIAFARERGYDLSSLRGRQLSAADLKEFDIILTMDNSNYKNTLALDPEGRFGHKILKMTSLCKIHEREEVPDPYHQGDDGFRLVLDILEDACTELALKIKAEQTG